MISDLIEFHKLINEAFDLESILEDMVFMSGDKVDRYSRITELNEKLKNPDPYKDALDDLLNTMIGMEEANKCSTCDGDGFIECGKWKDDVSERYTCLKCRGKGVTE